MSERLFGASVRRREDARLVTGRGRYVADLSLPGMLDVAVHRSPHAHAQLVRVDAGEARHRPGVASVLVPSDVAALGRLPLLVPHPSLIAPACPEILPQEVVSYAGQPVALVVAESAAAATDAVEALRVAYEPLPAVASLDDALRADGPRVHPGGNVASRFTQRVGDPAAAMAQAEVVLRQRFHLHRGAGMAMETRAIAARWDADLGQVTVWSTTQAPQILRRMLARYLGLPEHAVRVVTQDIGGGFGPKAIVYSEDILIPWLARALGRPVRFAETRREHLLAVTQERDQWHDAELGLTRDGRIVALRDSFVHDCGAFVSWGVIVPLITSVSVPGPYRVPHYEVTLTALYTNRVPVTPVRGAGRPQAVFVMERMLDLAAARLGIDRVAIREKNLIQPHEFPYDVGLISRDNSPRRYDSGNYPECLRRAAAAVGWSGFAAERERARGGARHRHRLRPLRGGHGPRPLRGHPRARRSRRARLRLLRHVQSGSGARDDDGPDRRRRPLRAARAGHRGAGRHRRPSLRRRHLRQPGGRAGERLGEPRRRRGAQEGARGRRRPPGSGATPRWSRSTPRPERSACCATSRSTTAA
jgi:CO/xanthine dehydrogenase Mo-binding subunit